MVTLRIKEKLKSVKADVANKEALLKTKKADWPAHKIHEMEEEIEKLQNHLKRTLIFKNVQASNNNRDLIGGANERLII